MKILKVQTIFLLLGLTVNALAADSECVVISGLEKDESNAFWDFKDQNLYQGCKVYKSIKEFAKTAPSDRVIDLRVISHGKKDGTLVCDAGDESPAEVIHTLNLMSEKNKVFISLDSCYSEQVLKEKILADNKNLSSQNAQNNLCLYASSAPLRETFVDQTSFADFHFKGKVAPRNISVLDLYNQTAVGLLSAAPYDESSVTSFWAGEDVKTAVVPFLETMDKLMNSSLTLPTEKCETLVLATKLNPIHFGEISQSILNMSRAEDMFKFAPGEWKELILSFDRLLNLEGTRDYFQAWNKEGYDYARFRDVDKLCKDVAPRKPSANMP